MKKVLQSVLLIQVFLIFGGCQKEQPAKVETTPIASATAQKVTSSVSSTANATSAAAPVAHPKATATEKDWLAKLVKLTNQVEYRQRNQNIWNQAEGELSFMKYDALQTKNSATAEVVYQSGSTLDVRENTLIIFDEDPGKKKKAEDRVIIKSGQLTGRTKTELWIFTDAGLVQIKAKKGQTNVTKVAEAKVVVKNDRAVNIKVKTGTAEVIYKKDNEYTRLAVAENADVSIKPSTELTSGVQVNADKVSELVTAQTKVAAVAQAELTVDFPADNALVQDSEIEIRGRLTGAGAKLLINGQLAEVSDASTFSKKINLQPGTNLIVFQLVRSDATVKFLRRSVRYQAK
ncbi:hypothetical protein [Pseudobdellovibrio sp. HCB154]|uniref:hypothetical protein n=1 Tax=Pseudobdellovibrio sp. HCB154 TaxID=3386277 RepID=UPI0039174517